MKNLNSNQEKPQNLKKKQITLQFLSLRTSMKKHFWVFLIILCTVGFVGEVWFGFPGRYNYDTYVSLSQAQTNKFQTWHPLAMALVWRFLILIFGTEKAFLFWQFALFAVGVLTFALFLHRKYHKPLISLIPLIFFILPNVLVLQNMLMKDMQLSFSLLIAFSLILHLTLKNNLAVKITLSAFAFIFLFYATAIRSNGIFATLPLVLLLLSILLKSCNCKAFKKIMLCVKMKHKHRLKRVAQIALTLCVSLLFIFSITIVNKVFDYKIAQYNDSSMTMYNQDIANTASYDDIENSNVLTPKLKNLARTLIASEISQFSNPRPNYRDAFAQAVPGVDDYSAWKKFWRQMILKHPKSYVMYKIYATSMFFFTTRVPDLSDMRMDNGEVNSVGFNYYTLNTRQLPLDHYLKWCENNALISLLFNRLVYVIMSFILLIIALHIKSRQNPYRHAVLALSVSSLLSYIPFIIGSLSTDYRFTYYNMFAVTIAVMLLMVNWRQTRSSVGNSA